MSDLLNVTTPVTPKPYNNSSRDSIQNQGEQIFNLSEMNKVNKTNDRNEEYTNQDTKDGSGALNITASGTKNPSSASAILRSVVGGEALRALAGSGNSDVLNKVTEFASEVMLSPSNIASDLAQQEKDSTIYSGDLWNEVKDMLASSSSADVAEAVVSFARAASDASARDSILSSISSGLKFLAGETAQSQDIAKQLNEAADSLTKETFGSLQGSIQSLLGTIQNSLLLSDGTKNLTSLITYNLSRFNGNTDDLGQSFNALLDLAGTADEADKLRGLFTEYIETSGLPDDIKLASLQSITGGAVSPASSLTVMAEKLGAAFNRGSERLTAEGLMSLLGKISNTGGTEALRSALSVMLPDSKMSGALNNILRSYDSTGNIQSLLDRLSIMINSVDNMEMKNALANKVNDILANFEIHPSPEIAADSIVMQQSMTLLAKDIGAALENSLPEITAASLSRRLSGLDENGGAASIRAILTGLLPKSSAEDISTFIRGFNTTGDLNKLIDNLSLIINSVKDTDKKIILAQCLNQILGKLAESGGVSYKPPTSMANLFDFLAKNINDTSLKSLSSMSRTDMVQGLLSSPGVYTPLLHYLVPVDDDGMKAFGELWADPDSEQQGGSKTSNHLFLCFEIEGMGYFELEVTSQDKSLSVQLLCPSGTEAIFRPLKDSIPQIASQAGYSTDYAKVGTVVKRRDLTQVFPKLQDKRSGLNVKI